MRKDADGIRTDHEPVHPLYADATALYRISFPNHEQREEASQKEILSNPAYHFDAVTDGGSFVGEILYWDIGGFLYVEHFCVRLEMRNRRYGQRILAALQEKHALILEIDPPIDAIAQRRKGFYKRCGFTANPYPHVHPAHHRGNAGHELVVMSSPDQLTPEEYGLFNQFLQDVVMRNVY